MSERIQNVQPQEWNGVKYRSTLEAKTAQTLDRLGIPFQYEERTITLQEGFRSPFQKDKVRALTYTPDFILGNLPILIECKGFETPEWRIKKKLLLKWLLDNEPGTVFYQIHDARKSLLEVLDKHLLHLGYAVKVIQKPKGKKDTPAPLPLYDSIQQAMEALNLKGRSIGPILGSLTGDKQYVYGYNWSLLKINSLL